MSTSYSKYKLKIESPLEIVVYKFYKEIFGKQKAIEVKNLLHSIILRKKYFRNGYWNFNGIILPDTKRFCEDTLMYYIYLDSLFVYCKHSDNYNSELFNQLENFLPEGPYFYKDNKIDVTIQNGDIVLDAGAWIGDFSAYASIKGAIVYAFEPSYITFNYLRKTQELNKGIIAINKGLGDTEGLFFLNNDLENPGKNKITETLFNTEKIEVTTIDKFVADNNIKKIDFIKSDIEGYERHMILGAKGVLKKFSPKLAICTYHLHDDPEILKELILQANPYYTIVQKKNKLFAMVI